MDPAGTPVPDTVVIVHGLWVPGLAMGWLARRIARCGYAVRVWHYPSVRHTLSDNAEHLGEFCAALPAPRIHLVGHSLGGLVALAMLGTPRRVTWGRVVLAGPPYADSFSGRRLARLPGGRMLLGRSMGEWLGEAHALPDGHPEIGVIAGTRSVGLGRLLAPDLPRPNDGVVTLAETAVPGATGRVVLDVSHSAMLVSREVAQQCCAFLRHGAFAAPAEAA